ncbi:hypothetical protein B0A49_04847 [Cryomyces minteri]|uniref:Uncharacterized protein n=1 Tax=Cryomyces minteri TaxID=331657 RepID=A0A4U0XJG5_9PEZI|nr:hypothetical protein B0A49_04847 [Cryomyces minteri]
MATSFAIPPTFAQPADPYHQYSPLSSAHATPSNSANISPTSPHKSFYNAPHLSRQLRQPKSPLYVPAVLRPTEKPTRPYPMTPPASAQNSFEGKSSMRGMDGINRRMTNTSVSSGISRVVSDEWNDEALGKVSGATTKNHWKPTTPTTKDHHCLPQSSQDQPKPFHHIAIKVLVHVGTHCGLEPAENGGEAIVRDGEMLKRARSACGLDRGDDSVSDREQRDPLSWSKRVLVW